MKKRMRGTHTQESVSSFIKLTTSQELPNLPLPQAGWPMLGFILLYNALMALVLVVRPASPQVIRLLDDIMQFAGPGLVVILYSLHVWMTARRTRRVTNAAVATGPRPLSQHRWAAHLLTAGVLCYTIGQLIFTLYEQVLHQQAPLPSWSDLFFLSAYTFLFMGILALPTISRSRMEQTRILVDSLLVMITLITISWYFILGPMLMTSGESIIARIVGTAYPIADLVLIFVLLLLGGHMCRGPLRHVVRLLVLALGIIVITDSVYDYQSLHDTYITGGIVDLGWPLGTMLVGFVAAALYSTLLAEPETGISAPISPSEGIRPPLSLWRTLLPMGLIPLIGGLVVYTLHTRADDQLQSGEYAGGALVIILVVLRQIFALMETQRLYQQVENKNTALALADVRLRAVVASAPIVLFILDRTGVFTLYEGKGLEAPGLSPVDMVGRSIFDARRDDPEILDHARRALRGQEHTAAVTVGTSIFDVRWTPQFDQNGQVSQVIGVATDTTERAHAAVLQARHSQRAALRAEMGTALGNAGSMEKMLLRCADTITHHIENTYVFIWTVDPTELALRLQARSGLPLGRDGHHRSVNAGRRYADRVAEERRPFLTNNVLSDRFLIDNEWAWRESLVACAGHPLILDNKLLGVVTLFSHIPLTDDALHMLSSVTDLIGQGIERCRAEEVLKEREERFRVLSEYATDLVAVVDIYRIFRYASLSHQRILGYPAEKLIGRSLDDLIHPEDLAQTKEGFDTWMRQLDTTAPLEVRVRHADGTWRVLEAIGSNALYDTVVQGIIINSRDITERKQAELAMEQARREAEEANEAKSVFLSRMSHELRTPLNAILGFAQILELDAQLDGSLNSEQIENVGFILAGGKHLLRLVDEVLDISRIEAGRLELLMEDVQLIAVVREGVEFVLPLADQRAISLTVDDVLTNSDWTVWADRQRLLQVLLNLLSNAIKYNRDNGKITISACLVAGPQADATSLRLSVTDTGLGIGAEKLARLFVPFDRLGAERTSVEGSGLGMALSKNLVESMLGQIGVESTESVGSTFWVELPLKGPALTDPVADTSAGASDCEDPDKESMYLPEALDLTAIDPPEALDMAPMDLPEAVDVRSRDLPEALAS